MALDTSGALLEGIRYSTGNNVYTYPSDSVVIDPSALYSVTERAEYAVLAGSTDPSKTALEIGDPDLVFYWTRNEPGVTRFDYDSFSGRWMPMPGTSPRVVGNLSNDERLTIPVPDPARSGSAPYDLYIDESPRTSFSLTFIGSNPFSDPSVLSSLQVEVNTSGQLNFSTADVSSNGGKSVLFTGQGFVSRIQNTGSIGLLPDFSTTDYRIFMNPRPASGQRPLLRIGYGPYLTPEEVAQESMLTDPPSGTVRWSADTGRLKFAPEDIDANPEETVRYDGVFIGSASFRRTDGISVTSGWPNVAFNIPTTLPDLVDSSRYIVFAEKVGSVRSYFSCTTFKSSEGFPTVPPSGGWFYLDTDTGNVFLSASDVSNFSSWFFGHFDAILEVGAPGVGVRMRRSSVNGPGASVKPDFTVVYQVSQTLSDSLDTFPFILLPTVPLVDSGLSFEVDMNTGKYVGPLNDARDPTKSGFAYLLDLDTKRMKFAHRGPVASYTLPKVQSSVKLDGAALSSRGVQVSRDGVPLSASEFDLDAAAGVLEFVEPVGEGDPNSRDVVGTASGSDFVADSPAFLGSDVGKRLLIGSGDNSGIRDIVSVASEMQISVDPPFVSVEAVSASVRATDEVIADRFWTPVSSVPKKFSLYRSSSGPSGTFAKVDVGSYLVKPNVGQVSFTQAARPGEVFRIEYVSLDSTDGGVTTTSTNRTEMALFKISQETPTFVVGSKTATFNPSGKTVSSTDRPPTLYIEGVTQDPASYVFTPPGTLTLKDKITTGPITIDYWVEEANGGELVADLLHSPIDYDSLKVSGPIPGSSPGDGYLQVSGDQTDTLKPGGALLVENKDMLYIASSSYDASTDLTKAVFAQLAVDDGESIKVTGIINPAKPKLFTLSLSNSPYMVAETSSVEIFVSGTNSVTIHGDALLRYRSGTVIEFDNDPYWVLGAKYDSTTDTTVVATAGSARRNYITPTIRRSVRPIVDPASSFVTSRPAYASRGFSLAKMGDSPRMLQGNGVDYDLGDDGTIKLKTDVLYGDVLRAMYVARVPQPAGTVFQFNFANEVAPSDSNGLAGQKLTMNYNLFAPDSFFYRVETVVSLLPEARQLAVSSASGSSSGPNIANLPSQQTKDAGLPSAWYFSMYYQSLDVVVQRFLKFYHDLIETYEDILALADGRIVGGSSGRFRYDGSSRTVTGYSDIKNDIDDQVKLYDSIEILSGFPFRARPVPVYGKMSDPNNLSRIFPTYATGSAFVGDVSSATIGQQVGSFKVKNILSIDTTTTARATAFFISSESVSDGLGSKTKLVLDATIDAPNLASVLAGGTPSVGTNGDADAFVPAFAAGMKVEVFNFEGFKVADGQVTLVDSVDPSIIRIDAVVADQIGGISQSSPDFSAGVTDNMQNMYAPGVDYLYAPDTGQIIYYKSFPLFPPNNPLQGNEVLEAPITFMSSDIAPKRIPALDGIEANDFGRPHVPRKRTKCEMGLLLDELATLRVGTGKHTSYGPDITDASAVGKPVSIGDTVRFINGPNALFSSTVASLFVNGFKLAGSPVALDASGSDFFVGDATTASDVLDDEIHILGLELQKLDEAVAFFGTQTSSGTGSASSVAEWNDPLADLSGTEGMLLWVKNGPSRGLWKISSSTVHAVVVDPSYPPLVVGSGGYSILIPWTFLQEVEFKFVASFYRSTLVFLQSTQSWSSSMTFDDALARLAAVKQRQADLSGTVGQSGSLTSLLKNGDNLYDTRYLWIDQRTNKETGLLQLQARAGIQALETLSKIASSQRKALLMDSLIGMM